MGTDALEERDDLMMGEKGLNTSLALSVHGDMGERALLWLAGQAAPCSLIVEVGSLHGRSALAMLANSNAYLCCVDAWGEGGVGGTNWKDYREFMVNVYMYLDRMTVLRALSHQGALVLLDIYGKGAFDMVFIDGGHDYSIVRGDILCYKPLLREGGLLCGHDYSEKFWPGVYQAVNELVDEPNQGPGCIWWTRV